MKVIIDSNVIFSGLYSSRGASFQVLRAVQAGTMEVGLSVALYEEYVDVLNRAAMREILSNEEREAFLDFFCTRSALLDVFYLWRPFLKDPKDDLVLEAAVAFEADAILTYNIRDFRGCETFGIRALTPSDYQKERKMK